MKATAILVFTFTLMAGLACAGARSVCTVGSVEKEIGWLNMSGSAEGAVRKSAVGEALQAARSKAELLAEEGKARLGKLLEVTEEEVEVPEYGRPRYRNCRDPRTGTALYPIEVVVKVRARFELVD